jgi:hypothetical protein
MRAGDSVEDYCRVCKIDRMHTVIAADPNGVPIRVACGYCSSEHNFRGGPRIGAAADQRGSPSSSAPRTMRPKSGREPFPLVSERERIAPPMAISSEHPDVELLIRRILREEAGVSAVAPADRWRGGTLILKPGNDSQERSWPIETFFHKVVMIRNRLRTLEQQINGMEIPGDTKVRLQAYISGCYGSLTSFNVLFADEGDQFKGSGDSQAS